MSGFLHVTTHSDCLAIPCASYLRTTYLETRANLMTSITSHSPGSP